MNFDSPDWRTARDQKLLDWMQGDHHARAFILQLSEVAEVWDDLIDGDHVPPERLHNAFITAIFDLSGNPFFTQHREYLRPLVMAGMNAWLDSTTLEKRSDSWAKTWAYALRDYYMELVPACAFLVGGYDHMRQVSIEAREFFQAETLEEFLGRTPVAEKVRVWLQALSGEILNDPVIEPAANGMVRARFKVEEPFPAKGSTLYIKVPGLGLFTRPMRFSTLCAYPGDELRAEWSLH